MSLRKRKELRHTVEDDSIRKRFTHSAQRLSPKRQQSQCDSLNEDSGQLPPTCSHFASDSLS
nr:PREDICTED: ankyrin repeat and fibronectin type-III domain-containing protein 1-like [Struthio camelus australis]